MSAKLQVTTEDIVQHQARLRACTACPDMLGPVVTGQPVVSPVMLIGQAPGAMEGPLGRPFAWTAGKTLFKWFTQIGLDEAAFRSRVYMAAVCRCFPGKLPKGGDRVPSRIEVERCGLWLEAEYALLQPRLLIPVGKLAIARYLPVNKLATLVGQTHSTILAGRPVDIVPLPHPSGLSTWHRTQPGIDLLQQALTQIAQHSAWQEICDDRVSV